MEQQPFYVGQKVVRTGKTTGPFCIKGKVYEVARQEQCVCGDWRVSMVDWPNHPHIGRMEKAICCNNLICSTGHYYARAKYFAPLNPPRVSAIPELLKAPVEERVDHRQPIKILTTDG